MEHLSAPTAPIPTVLPSPDQVAGRPTHPSLRVAELLSGSRWCLLRPPAPGDVEVDLLLHPDDLPSVTQQLSRAGVHRYPAWGRGTHAFFHTYVPASDTWVKLDVVTELAYGPYQELRTGLAERCLARARDSDGVPVLAADDEFWTLLLHSLLDREQVAPRHGAELMRLTPEVSVEGDWADLLRTMPGAPAPEQLRDLLLQHRVHELPRAAAALRASWTRSAGVSARYRRTRNRALLRSTKILVPVRRPGLSVALLGPDGAGKSTLARELAQTLPFPTRTAYLGQYQEVGQRPRMAGVGLLAKLAGQCLSAGQAEWQVRRGRILVSDRHPYDALLPSASKSAKTRVRRWLLGHTTRRPELVLVLDAPAELLFERSGEHGVAALEEQRKGYASLASRLPQAERLDAAQPAALVRRGATALIFHRFAQQWRT